MKALTAICLLGGVFSSASCVLPVPHRRVHVLGIEAKVVRATDDAPIPGARVSTLHGGRVLAVTDAAGHFEVKPRYGWHGAYLVGPISYSMLPHFDMPWPRPPFRVSADGFQARSFDSWGAIEKRDDEDVPIIRLSPVKPTRR